MNFFTACKKQRASDAQRRAHEAYAAKHIRYAIRYQWRNPQGLSPGRDRYDAKAWLHFGALPLLFHTREEAQKYIETFPVFKNMEHLRKVSCYISKVKIR